MSNQRQETIEDIVSEMREFADTDSQTIGRDVLRKRIQDFARRIEHSVTDCNQFGNDASIRKSLEALVGVIDECNSGNPLWWHIGAKGVKPLKDARAALSSPLRNCDKYTLEEAFHKYGSPTKGHPWEEIEWLDFLEWLFSEAKGDEK